jgi:hypothetical protein
VEKRQGDDTGKHANTTIKILLHSVLVAKTSSYMSNRLASISTSSTLSASREDQRYMILPSPPPSFTLSASHEDQQLCEPPLIPHPSPSPTFPRLFPFLQGVPFSAVLNWDISVCCSLLSLGVAVLVSCLVPPSMELVRYIVKTLFHRGTKLYLSVGSFAWWPSAGC